MTLTPEDFGPIRLSAGAHKGPDEGVCAMEMVGFLAGEEWSGEPECASPVVAEFCRSINDGMDQAGRDRLRLYAPRLIGTASPEHDQERAEYLAWQAITVFAPIALDKAGHREHAKRLRDFDRDLGFMVAADVASSAARAARAGAVFASAAVCAAARAADAAAANAPARAAYEASNTAARAKDTGALFTCLEGLLEIGPSGDPDAHMDRIPALAAAMGEVA